MSTIENKKDAPAESFADESAWGKWLAAHHKKSAGIWLRILLQPAGWPNAKLNRATHRRESAGR